MSVTNYISILLIILIVYLLFKQFYRPSYLKPLTQEEFIKGYRKAQLIDVREQREYDGGHILGARNIPLSQLKQRMNEIRTDQPVYLYDQTGARSSQAAQRLRKKRGVEELYVLKGGFRKWTGRIKKK